MVAHFGSRPGMRNGMRSSCLMGKSYFPMSLWNRLSHNGVHTLACAIIYSTLSVKVKRFSSDFEHQRFNISELKLVQKCAFIKAKTARINL